ncbi:MAG TPA: DUF305 domain-containing protein [Actinocatenispora sp.]
MFRPTHVRRALLAATAAVVLSVAAGCGGTEHSAGHPAAHHSAAAAAGHNAADVMFAQMMIPHHRQAVEMAELAPSRASSRQVVDLAARIAGAQDPEIRTMSSWLRSWGEAVPSPDAGDHDMAMADGMMSDGDMAKLKAARGREFDAMFARMMIAHHQGAIAMARDEAADGRYPKATSLAAGIVRTQSAEVTTLKGLAGDR